MKQKRQRGRWNWWEWNQRWWFFTRENRQGIVWILMTQADRVPEILPNHFWSQQYSRPLLHSPKKSHIYMNVVVSKVSQSCCHRLANTKKVLDACVLSWKSMHEYCGLPRVSIFVLTILLLSQRKKGQIWEKLNSYPVNIIVTSKLWRIYWITFVMLQILQRAFDLNLSNFSMFAGRCSSLWWTGWRFSRRRSCL